MIELAENRYGKSRVRLMKVTRHAPRQRPREWTVQVLLTGDFDSAHFDGDNSKILPTDTMKNTVYSVARNSTATSMEDYAKELVDFLLGRNPQVSSAAVAIESTLWKRLTVDGKPYPTAFMRGSDELQTTTSRARKTADFQIHSGLDNLIVIKTADSAFEGYIKDAHHAQGNQRPPLLHRRHRRLALHQPTTLDFDASAPPPRSHAQAPSPTTTASPSSKRSTPWAKRARTRSRIDEIDLLMPNKHCLLVDLSRFGQDNPNQIFVPTDEPAGHIEARVRRKP